MKNMIRATVSILLALSTSAAFAAFHLWNMSEIYSNSDGTIQFVVWQSGFDGENLLGGQVLTSNGPGGKKTFTFPKDLPSSSTQGKSFLVATQGFAALGIVTPDYIVPNNFLSLGSGSVNYANVQTISYTAGQLPTDGVNAMYVFSTPAKNVATNFAGMSGSVTNAGGGTPTVPNYQGLWWNAPAGSESGWGINFAHQGDVIFATWFTYDLNGKAWWLTMSASKTADGVYSGPIFVTTGAPFSAFVPPANATQAGTGTLTFSSTTSGTFAYTVNGVTQTKNIVPQVFGTVPTCVWGAQPDLTKATANYEDLWWAAWAARNRDGASTSRSRAM